MTKNEILNEIKKLDETNIYPYLYTAITKDKEYEEKVMRELVDKKIKNVDELYNVIEEVFYTKS
jgi:hypothetical protein